MYRFTLPTRSGRDRASSNTHVAASAAVDGSGGASAGSTAGIKTAGPKVATQLSDSLQVPATTHALRRASISAAGVELATGFTDDLVARQSDKTGGLLHLQDWAVQREQVGAGPGRLILGRV